MHHPNDMNYPASSSYYNYNNQSHFQNPNPIPSFAQFPSTTDASAPPDPSIYYSDHSSSYSSAYYPHDHQNQTPQNLGYVGDPAYDPNLMPSLYHHHQNQAAVSFGGAAGSEGVYAYDGRKSESSKVSALSFDDYGRPIIGGGIERRGSVDVLENDKVHAYGGGDKGKQSESSRVSALRFDDYGRPLNLATDGRNEQKSLREALDDDKIVKATPKVDVSEDVGGGAQKFRVNLLSEWGGGQGDMDVLCQFGLDGIRILDPATSRTLKIYPLETVTRWEILDSNVFAFWTKSSIDIDERRVRLKSNGYTTTNILDMVAAASFQLKEMGGIAKTYDSHRVSEQPAEKKKGFPDWISLMKPGIEEKDHWVPDEASTKCTACRTDFGAFVRRHHCRNCGDIFCDKCTQGRIALTAEENAQQVRVCDGCMAEVTQRLTSVNEVAGRASSSHRHEDLAKKLQVEMDKKRRTESKSNMADERMREVECPTCTVHLQVEVPASGSKTVECSVCQHPFLVAAH